MDSKPEEPFNQNTVEMEEAVNKDEDPEDEDFEISFEKAQSAGLMTCDAAHRRFQTNTRLHLAQESISESKNKETKPNGYEENTNGCSAEPNCTKDRKNEGSEMMGSKKDSMESLAGDGDHSNPQP